MKYVSAYDIEADEIDDYCVENDITEPELVEAMWECFKAHEDEGWL